MLGGRRNGGGRGWLDRAGGRSIIGVGQRGNGGSEVGIDEDMAKQNNEKVESSREK